MNPAWSYFWPAVGLGMIAGVIAGMFAFRRRNGRTATLIAGLIVAVALAALWHGPLGAADRFAQAIDRNVRSALVYNEIPQVSGHLQRDPLARRVLLSGPANDFQRSELVRVIGGLPGVSRASWSSAKGGLPLVAEGGILAVVGFLTGLLLAYLVELRRRYNSQWKW
jgi:hypothetical protein